LLFQTINKYVEFVCSKLYNEPLMEYLRQFYRALLYSIEDCLFPVENESTSPNKLLPSNATLFLAFLTAIDSFFHSNASGLPTSVIEEESKGLILTLKSHQHSVNLE